MTLSTFADVDPEVPENAVNVSLAEAHPGEISVYSSSGLCLVVKPGGTYGSSNEVITTNNIWVKCKRIKKQPGIQYEICTPVNCPDGEFHY